MDEVVDIYTNSVRLMVSIYDFTLEFRLATQDETRPVARVRMSPQQAKALHILLGKFLQTYAETFQEVVLPEELESRLTGAEEAAEQEEDAVPNTRQDEGA